MEYTNNIKGLLVYVLLMSVSYHATAIKQSIGSCDFEVTDQESSSNLCGYTHGPTDSNEFFDWTLEDSNGEHYMNVKTELHQPGQKARLYSPEIRQQNTHCYSFQYHIEGGLSTNASEPVNSLNVYVLDKENGEHILPVWQSGLNTYQSGWTTVQLALNPRAYRVVFEANIAQSTPGVVTLDNIIIDNKACVSTPHFLRMGNKEVNEGQDITLTCLLWGHNFTRRERSTNETVLIQKFTGEVFPPTTEKSYDDHLSVELIFPAVDSDKKGQYRCISQTSTSAGVSNFATVDVKVPPVPQRPPDIKDAGSTYLNISLNAESYVGDAPIIKTVLNYRPLSDGLWSDSHEISSPDYHLWHLKPDTTYELRVTLSRPGKGGQGKPGPVLSARTSCGAPRKPVAEVQIQAIASTELKVMWQAPDFSVVQCHYHSYIIKYRKYIPSNSSSQEIDFNEVSATKDDNFAILYELSPYTRYEVKIVLDNSQGAIETRSLLPRTGEGEPEAIPEDSLVVTHSNETSISLAWDEPEVTNGVVVAYEVTCRGIATTQPDFIPQEDSGFFTVNENNITIRKLHAGTTYRFHVRARTGGGNGPFIEAIGKTQIAAPKLAEYPPPVPDNGTASTPTTIQVNILPAEANGGPISSYYIVIEEVGNAGDLTTAEDASKQNKRKNGSRSGRKRKKNRRRQKRQTFIHGRVKRQTEVNTKDRDSPCYSDPITYDDAKKQNKTFYFGGKLTPDDVSEGVTFVVGEGGTKGGFENPPLDPNKKYNVYIRVDSNVNNDSKVNCALVAIKASTPSTTTAPPVTTQVNVVPTEVTTKDATNVVVPPDQITDGDGNLTIDDAEQTDNDNLVLYAGVGASVFFILLLIVIIIIIIKNRRGRMRPKDEVVNPFEVRMMMSDMIGTANTHSMTRSFGSPDRQALMMPDVVDFENHDFMEKTMDASGTRVSGTFHSASTPMVEDRPVLRVDDFHIHVNDMKRQNNFGFHEEFSTFREGQTAAWDVGKREQNRNKNRYGNIMAYDHSRVILEAIKGQDDLESDYINANYIMGYKSPSMYVAAQAPSAETMNDFWLMIWQENAPVIVMVTNLVELGKRKCHKYWPDDTEQFGAIKVSLTDTEELSDYTIRTFIIQLEGGYDVREVKQFHFTAWPDHGVPEYPTGILSFIRRVKSYEPPGEGLTVVHCSAGCGRTGCFIVIDMMLDMAREEGVIDIYNTVNDLRNRRVNMVQTEEQYIFIHNAVLEVLLCGDTLVAAQDLRQHYDDLITVDEQTQIAPVQEEFETLDVMTPKLTEEECAVAKLPRNRQRNRFMDVLPPDRKMPYLVTPHPNDPDSNYINAIFADSYVKRDAFIITQMPLPNTVIDFWRLIYDYNCSSIVMMNDSTEHDQTCAVYWPDTSSTNFGPFNIEVVQKEDEVDVVTRVFKVQNIRKPNEGYRFVQQFQLTNWPAAQPVPYTRNAVLRVIQLVTKWQNEHSNDGRILIHCVAGAGRSGTFAACYNLCMQLRREGVVDVFNIVQRLRNIRPQLVETLEQYRFCYEVGWDFADQ